MIIEQGHTSFLCSKLLWQETSSCLPAGNGSFSECSIQKSLEGCLICIHKSKWLLLASESAFVGAILAMCVQRPSQTSLCKCLAPIFKKDAEDFHVIEVALEGTRPQRPEPVLRTSRILLFPISHPCCLCSSLCTGFIFFPCPHGVERGYLNQS